MSSLPRSCSENLNGQQGSLWYNLNGPSGFKPNGSSCDS